MVILFLSCRKLPRPKNQTPTQGPRLSLNPPRFYLTSKVCPNSFAAALQQQGVRAVFKSETTLRSHLVRPKDPADPTTQDGVVYRIPCECGKVYIGETGRPMQDKRKEHDGDSPVPRPPPFQSTPTTPDTTRFEMR